MLRGPCLSQPINREFIHCYQGTESSIEESWNQIESYSVWNVCNNKSLNEFE